MRRDDAYRAAIGLHEHDLQLSGSWLVPVCEREPSRIVYELALTPWYDLYSVLDGGRPPLAGPLWSERATRYQPYMGGERKAK